MNKRERILLFTLVGLLIVGGGWAMYYFFHRKPMDQIDQRIERVQNEIRQKEQEEQTIAKNKEKIELRNPHLRYWKQISLPEVKLAAGKTRTPEDTAKHLAQVEVKYEQYLSGLLRQHLFTPASISVTPKPPDSKSSPTIVGSGPIYTKLAFVVKGQASLAAIEQMLTEFYHDPLLQEVHSLTITKPATSRQLQLLLPGAGPAASGTDLDVDMTVEVLLVKGAEPRDPTTDLKPTLADKSLASVLADPERRYDDILGKNIFLGTRGDPRSANMAEDRNLVLRFVRLTTISTNGRRWEAYLYDMGKGLEKGNEKYPEGTEKLLTVERLPDFTIKDKYGNEVLAGKVVLLDDKLMVFQSPPKTGKYYKMTTGDVFLTALSKPLKNEEIKALGLTPPAGAGAAAAPAADQDKAAAEEAPPPE